MGQLPVAVAGAVIAAAIALTGVADGSPARPAGPAPAGRLAAAGRAEGRSTRLVSRSVTGGLPNGPSSHPAISLDQRYARVLAFQSSATNLVSGAVGSAVNVYYIVRRGSFGNWGSRWVPGPIRLASRGLGGAPANGDSSAPAVSGDNHHPARCIAFVSAASNLVPGDSNGHPDAFVYHLRSRTIQRVSVGPGGREADGSAYDVAVNGDCSKVAFTEDASDLVAGTPPGVRQVYVRDLRRGRTLLVSARAGHPGDADSSQPAFGGHGDVAFASRAGNLAGPTGGHLQVLRRNGAGPPRMLSRARSGAPGSGDSDQPALTQFRRGYAFRTRASNLAAGAGRFSEIVHGRSGRRPASLGRAPNGDAARPDVVNQGYYVLFDDGDPRATGQPYPQPGAYLYTAVRHRLVPVSADSHGLRLSLPGSDPASSEAANYIFFETSDPRADLAFAHRHRLAGVPTQTAAAQPAFHQIYLRYLGPK